MNARDYQATAERSEIREPRRKKGLEAASWQLEAVHLTTL
jgi:hypothetical protein